MPLNAIHVGMSGFPAGSASVNKCIAVYQSLNKNNFKVLAINNRAFHRDNVYFKIEKKGEINGVRYIYTSPSPFKSKSFLGRRSSNFLGKANEFFLLSKLAIRKEVDIMFFYPNGSFAWLIYYRLFSLIFNFPIIAHYVEFRSAFGSRKSLLDKISDKLFDKYFVYFTDGILPISEFLMVHLQHIGCKKPLLKVPPLTDFTDFLNIDRDFSANYFLYVGSAAYLEAVRMIFEAFELADNKDFELHLVVSGNPSEMALLKNLLDKSRKAKSIKMLSNLTYPDLLKKYINSKANLIPLSNSMQDTARFPQKIAEYLASGNPIITTNNGEVPYYFQDENNALVAESYSPDAIAKKMSYVANYPEQAAEIGKRGYELGIKYFDLNAFKLNINKFVDSITAKEK